jgi:copper chaperone CopZ
VKKVTVEKIVLKAEKTDCTGCRVCAAGIEADNLRHAIARLNGVSKVNVDEITGKVTVEHDQEKIDFSKIAERIEKLGYKVEILSRVQIQ